MPNALNKETSLYLLQHQHNPVEWQPWGKDALQRAEDEDKPILVSIGYSACHWCHVMEHESFEDEAVADLMNEHFVCIKIDREERPDIDAIYMEAVQAMGIRGGWPLHVILMPDRRPFYGGTYFPKDRWVRLLTDISRAFTEHREALQDSANGFLEHLQQPENEKYTFGEPNGEVVSAMFLDEIYQKLSVDFDTQRGGTNRSPKFPMPSIWLFLLRYYQHSNSKPALGQVRKTLDAMARGGIYDQLGGGFARYSTDGDWLLPHFEKMLYDNGQLLSLYSEAWLVTKEPEYQRVVVETIHWLTREMQHPEGGFYAAIDADSEGEEGKFYTWKRSEVKEILGEKKGELIADFFSLTEQGNFLDEATHTHTGANVLYAKESRTLFEMEHGLLAGELDGLLHQLFLHREKRIRPGLDTKVLTAWNGIALRGILDAYKAFGNEEYLVIAQKSAEFIRKNLVNSNGLWHTFQAGNAKINGFLDDYAFVIDAFVQLYHSTFDESYLTDAIGWTTFAIEQFFDTNDGLFHYSAADDLIAQKKEWFDNVIPSSNAQMAINLFWLGQITDEANFSTIAHNLFNKIRPVLAQNPGYLSQWARLGTYLAHPTVEIAIVGEECLSFRKQLEKRYLPNKVIVGTKSSSQLPLLQNRTSPQKTTIYVCQDRTCRLPVGSVQEAWELVG